MLPTRQLGKNGPEFTVIGFGAWAIGGPWAYGWGPQDDRESINAIHAAIDMGINWIDTAAVYGLGHSEEIVGKAIKGKRDQVYIATKCGLVWDSQGRVKGNINPGSIRQEVENSLRRLDIDVIDLYQIHWPDGKTPEEKAWEMMLKLKDEGKVRWIGVSNFDVEKLQKCLSVGPVQSLQPPYNLVRREVEKSILPFCKENGIGVVAYSPMMSGLLSGKFDINRLASDDWRRKSAYFQEPFLSRALNFVEKLRPMAEKYGKTVAQFSIGWVLQHPAITSAIVGARRPSQVEEIVGAADLVIDPEDMKIIDEWLRETIGDDVYRHL
ncbi:MAG: aldo/keto reductase [Methanobacteriota archaeon]|nr:MAG: aldo/keto reductase [Euryarchaeota archaeon]